MCGFQIVNRLYRLFATGLYTGYSPIAPGTVGSLLALSIYLLIPGFRDGVVLLTVGICFFVGVVSAGEVEKTEGHDASLITVDEIVGMWLTLLFLPKDLSLIWSVMGFLLFRGFDIWKPFPINLSQKLRGGWGVMMDDVLAGIYANVVLRFIVIICI